jgi:hypothetical protein
MGTDAMSNLATAGGTLFGVILGIVSTWLIERGRRKYENAHRWSEVRASVYLGFLRARAAFLDNASRLRRETGGGLTEEEVKALQEQVGAALESCRETRAEISLIGSARVTETLEPLLDRLGDLLSLARAGVDDGSPEWADALGEISSIRTEFLDACRVDLGIEGSPVGPPLSSNTVRAQVESVSRGPSDDR